MDQVTEDRTPAVTGRDSESADDSHGTTREPSGSAPWVVVSAGTTNSDEETAQPRQVLAMVALGALVVLVVVSIVGVAAARALAERQAVNDAANTADLLAEAVVQGALENSITTSAPAATAALDRALKEYVASSTLVRVKVWGRDGRILYSDEPRLIGEKFDLGAEEREVFVHPRTRAEVSDLTKPENRYERGQGRLLEAYRPVWTPNGTPLLFETYSPYGEVDQRAGQMWRGFAGVTVSSLLLFTALLVPLMWRLLTKVRAAQRQREALLQRAVDASADERRRIAGTLHDGVVQELAGTSFAISGAASRAETLGDPALSTDLQVAAGTLRDSIGGLRTLLVDIYPETLESSGLLDVLRDLASTMRSRDIGVHLELPEDDPDLGVEVDRVVFRIVHECLQNVRRHSGAENVWLRMQVQLDAVVVEIEDDGVGFDAVEALSRPKQGHFGLRLLADATGGTGAVLEVASAPGSGCRWRLTVPR